MSRISAPRLRRSAPTVCLNECTARRHHEVPDSLLYRPRVQMAVTPAWEHPGRLVGGHPVLDGNHHTVRHLYDVLLAALAYHPSPPM